MKREAGTGLRRRVHRHVFAVVGCPGCLGVLAARIDDGSHPGAGPVPASEPPATMVQMTEPLHALHAQLLGLGVVGPEPPELFHDRVRDRDDIAVYRCPRSGVVFLGRIDHVDDRFYVDKDHPGLRALGTRTALTASLREDTDRRVRQFAGIVTNRDWLDVGTGAGAVLDAMGDRAKTVAAVEPQGRLRTLLEGNGYIVHPDISDVGAGSVDVVTEFHVFEHISDPLDHLCHARRVLRPDGMLVLEVPHASDFLLTFLGVESFRAFTVWSEHLVLHTRSSLRRLLEVAGFGRIVVAGFQRYPLANHLHWLARGQPGGHERWTELRDPTLDEAYAATLARLDATDTLIARAWPSA